MRCRFHCFEDKILHFVSGVTAIPFVNRGFRCAAGNVRGSTVARAQRERASLFFFFFFFSSNSNFARHSEDLGAQWCNRRVPSGRRILPCIQDSHIVGIKLKVVYVLVLLDPTFRNTFRKYHKAHLQVPSQKYLRWGFAVFLGQRLDPRIIEAGAAAKRGVCFEDDVTLATP